MGNTLVWLRKVGLLMLAATLCFVALVGLCVEQNYPIIVSHWRWWTERWPELIPLIVVSALTGLVGGWAAKMFSLSEKSARLMRLSFWSSVVVCLSIGSITNAAPHDRPRCKTGRMIQTGSMVGLGLLLYRKRTQSEPTELGAGENSTE